MVLQYIIWNIKPQLLDLGRFEIRYYSILFALAFVFGYIILLRVFKKEGYSVDLLDKLTIYMVISTIIGARLGHCLFYEFSYYMQHPLEIILPWRGTLGDDFEFTGFQGLASHGAAIGILVGIYLFARKTKTSYLWTLDKIVIVTALGGALIRTGNLMNSEIYGEPTGNRYGFVFTRDFTHLLTYGDADKTIKKVQYEKVAADSATPENAVPLDLEIGLSNKIKNESLADEMTEKIISFALFKREYQDNIIHPDIAALRLNHEKSGRNYIMTARVYGIPRHPTQLYEAGAYLLIFFMLFWIYIKYRSFLQDGFILGAFFFLVFAARFVIEFMKENQEAFEDGLSLNMGQLLSIPFVVAGFIIMVLCRPKTKEASNGKLQSPSE
jgi:phosphatidylglycerol:prolipoprotein diacylglycerol transferase